MTKTVRQSAARALCIMYVDSFLHFSCASYVHCRSYGVEPFHLPAEC